ncbi:hypothetical protein [Nocardia cyriacigeorgica]|jgi:hypothetical protein|uniref:hypothetical protein n=1 Tax=Nocardia cyriacigeorgica TaxID=135487 RepID=UPI00245680DF|nr:hypothetical protein [Nocardia cyriacigeorgica]
MIVHSAQLPAQSDEDRIAISDHAVIVLDGATAHDPAMPRAGKYVDTLATELGHRIDASNDLRTALADAIDSTAALLRLTPGTSPSSTVSIVRVAPATVDLLVLGDAAAIVRTTDGTEHVHSDDRLERLELPDADRYRHRLASGAGYDRAHRDLLQSLQRAERKQRNQPGGFWVAEADPRASDHALTTSYARDEVVWAIAATDGAFDVLPALGVGWRAVASLTNAGLLDLLRHCQSWEATTDPHGQALPRAKRHDDKSVAVVWP